MNIIIKGITSPVGALLIASYGDKLCRCDWGSVNNFDKLDARLCKSLNANLEEGDSPVLSQAVTQLDEYFAGRRTGFTLPLLFVGTEFQKRVWETLLSIPYGETLSYGEMARRMGIPSSVRAVANANGANPIAIIAPCHRVIGSNHQLVGYGGGLESKAFLLDLERRSSH